VTANASLTVTCPCGVPVEVPVHIGVVEVDGRLTVEPSPDFFDLWAHACTHDADRSA
jgi:hypothetical protein